MIYEVTLTSTDEIVYVDCDHAYTNAGDYTFYRHVTPEGTRVPINNNVDPYYGDVQGINAMQVPYLTLARGEWRMVKLAPEQGE